MKIKEPIQKKIIYNLFKDIYTRRYRFKWLILIGLSLTILIGINLACISYGIYLHKNGQSMTLKRWISSVAQHKLSFIPNFFFGLFANPEHIQIDIKFKHFQKLAYKRQEALELGHLVSSPDDWVPANIRYRDETYRVALRLKGDTADHWKRDDRWSFKVKMKDNKTLFGMKRFAIQDPRTRNYLNQWFCHKLLEYYGLLHLRYDFIRVTINGKDKPVYAIEENFDKRIIENNRYREGPIVRFASGYQWGNNRGLLPYLMGASIDPYQNGKTMSSDALSQQFYVAKNLLELFRQNKLTVSEVFDVGHLARFFALNDLFGHPHGTSLDNLKFYYNPVTSLIQPLGYDVAGFFPLDQTKYGLWGAGKRVEMNSSKRTHPTLFKNDIFRDMEFFKEYIKSLEEISEKSFLDKFFNAVDKEYKEKLHVLHKSYPWYNFDGKKILYDNQKYIRDYLIQNKSLQVYYHNFSPESNSITLKIRNIHSLPTEILNLIYNDSTVIPPVKKAILQASIETEPIKSASVEFQLPDNLFWSDAMIDNLGVNYKILGASRSFQAHIISWKDLDDNFIENDFIRQKSNLNEFDFIAVDESKKLIRFISGDWNLNKNLIIPAGYKVIAQTGLNLDLSNSAKILSHSPILFIGSDEIPIYIHSSDATGQGLVVMNAEQDSELEHVHFDNLTNPSQNGWELTAAVTFYQSPSMISNCRFTKIRSEDALNIIRSRFEINNTIFSNLMSDAFDADFAKGKVIDSSFVNCGNDAIDVSGSVIELENIYINKVGDKGLSAGENSRLIVKQIEIHNAELGVASKDLSKIDIENITLYDNRVGFSVYQKKPEFGPAYIEANKIKASKLEVFYLLEAGSKLILEQKAVDPTGKDIKDILYGVQYGKSSN